MHNFLNNLPRNGDSAKSVNPNELIFSSAGINDKILPRTLGDLQKIVPNKYITYSVYANANGNVSKHDCWQYNFLVILGYTGNTVDGTVSVARTDWEPDSGGAIKLFGGDAYNFDNESWYRLYVGPKLLDKITSGNRDQPGPGGSCSFYPFGGWSEAKVSVLFFVTVDVRAHCTDADNIGNDFCFAMMDSYFQSKPGKVESSTTDYINQYCTRIIPNGDLSTASSNNQKICACNMPVASYAKYGLATDNAGNNISGIRTPCFLDDCLRSNFKPGNFNDCPAPQCLNVVNIDRSPVIGGNLTIDQKNECLNILKQYEGGNGDNGGGTNPVPVQESFFEQNKTIIIVIIVIIVLIIIGATIYFVTAE